MPRRAEGQRGRLCWGACLGAGLTAALAGCSVITQSPPQIDVADVVLTNIGLLNQSFLVTLCVTNPNPTSIAFHRVTFRIAVADAPLADGVTESDVAIPALASVLMPVAVQTTIRNLPRQLLSTLTTGSVAYRVSGVAQLTSLPFGVPFSGGGQFSLLQAGEAYAETAASSAATRCRPSPPFVEPSQ